MALLSSPAARMAAGASLLLVFLVPVSAAQGPLPVPDPTQADRAVVDFAVLALESFVEVRYNSHRQVMLVIKDLSRDSGSAEGLPGGGAGLAPFPHSVQLRLVQIQPASAQGWQVLIGMPFVPIAGGQTIEVPLTIQTTPQIDTAEIFFDIEAEYTGPNGVTRNQTVTLGAQVAQYDVALARITNVAQKAAQNEILRYEVMVTNDGVYPDTYAITVSTDKEAFHVVAPPNLYVPAKSTRYTNITVLTPKGKLYEPGQTAILNTQVKSLTGSGVYTTVGVVQVRGTYISTPWIPILLVGLVSSAILVRERALQSDLRTGERGRPRRVQPTPRQAVLLAELRRKDPEAYKAKRAALAALYAQRRDKYRGERKQRAAMEREERKQARLELKEEKKRLAAEKRAAKAQAKLDRKAAKKQAKLDKKQAKVDEKLRKKEEKVVGKKRKVLEKQKAKLEKTRAKAEAKEAKAQAKADKAAARAAKREAKAARQREKSEGGKP